jgi:hypothetical protein
LFGGWLKIAQHRYTFGCVFWCSFSTCQFSSFFFYTHFRKDAHATHQTQHNPKKPDQFRLHNESNGTEKKSRIVNRISKIFPASSSTSSASSSPSSAAATPESESQRPKINNDNFLMQSNGIENG